MFSCAPLAAETAINIGYSSKLLTENMRVFIVDSDTPEGVIGQLRDAGKEIAAAGESGRTADPFVDDDEDGEGRNEGGSGSEVLGPPFGIVLNGHSLVGLLFVYTCMYMYMYM